MATVEVPNRKSATVSLVTRPCRRSSRVNSTVPSGRATKASATSTKDQSVPVSGSRNGKMRAGKTITDAMAKTKKSKNSDVRPMMTPTAISDGETW